MNLRVWNHSASAQERPVLFVVPLGLGLDDIVAVGTEPMLASKQYDDGVDAVYMCPPPVGGWPVGTSPLPNYEITTYSGSDPNYRFAFHPVFAVDVCGGAAAYDFRFLPELRVYRTASDTNPRILRPTSVLPWSAGAHPTTGGVIQNGGDMRRYFSTSVHENGWHLFFHIWFDAWLGVAEFAAEVLWSNHQVGDTVAETKPNPTKFEWWQTYCDRIELVWHPTVQVKPKFNTEGIAQPTTNVMRLSTTFSPGTTSLNSNDYLYGSWDGKWLGQHGMVLRGFLLANNTDGTANAAETTRFNAAGALYGCLDEESWDGYWIGGGSSGYGVTVTNNEAQIGPRWQNTGQHFVTWERGSYANDTVGNIGMCCKNDTGNPGVQGNMDGHYGHPVLLGINSPRDYEAAAHDHAKRTHYVWGDGYPNPNQSLGWYFTEPGRPTISSFAEHGYPIMSLNKGNPASNSGFKWGRSTANRDGALLIRPNGSYVDTGWDDQHTFAPAQIAAFKLTKDPMTYQMVSWFLNTAFEISERRPGPGFPGSDIKYHREPRKMTALAAMWQSCPGLRPRVWDVMYNEQYGFYRAYRDRTNDQLPYRDKRSYVDDSPAHIVAASRDPSQPGGFEATIPNWSVTDSNIDESLINNNYARWGAASPSECEGQSPLWVLVGTMGMLAWYQALVDDDWNGRVDVNAAYVTDWKEWAETVTESMMDWGVASVSGNSTWYESPLYQMVIYAGGHMLQRAPVTQFYPPASPPHPFLSTVGSGGSTTVHPESAYMTNMGSANLSTWCLGAFNWYRRYGRSANYRARAQKLWEDSIKRDNGDTLAFKGWQQLFAAATAPLLPMTAP